LIDDPLIEDCVIQLMNGASGPIRDLPNR